MKFYIGCDLGGTNIKAGIVDITNGKVLVSKNTDTFARKGHDEVISRIAKVIQSVIKDTQIPNEEIGGIGVSAPGVLDLEKGSTLFLPNLEGQWRNVPLKSRLESYLHKPVCILNDVRAITFGEWAFGAGMGVKNMICFAVGTGVGGGVVINNQLVLSHGGTTGELGHITVEPNGPRCGCGNFGCVEVFSSGPAITTMGIRAVKQGWTTRIADLCDHDLNKITPKIIAEAANQGDDVAKEIWDTAGYYLGLGALNAAIAAGPERIVISGGVAAAGELLLKPIRKVLEERLFIMPSHEIEVVNGSLGSDAGIIGMAVWASKK